MTTLKTITFLQPDDWHCHFRDGAQLNLTVAHSAMRFARAIAMPNLEQPILNTAQALAYKKRLLAALPANTSFTPFMTLYLTDNTTPAMIEEAVSDPSILACKLYPAHATTNAAFGVTDLSRLKPVFEAMQSLGMPLLLHGEVTDHQIDPFDRERYFLNNVLTRMLHAYPALRIVLEHITTQEAVRMVQSGPASLAATITPHHLLYNRNALFEKGIRPHYYCLPILKREKHQLALIEAATSGNPKFFLGTDSAPHSIQQKENTCGCAGIYSAHAAIELYAEAFDKAKALDKLPAFASHFGADFYGLPRNTKQITLIQEAWEVPLTMKYGKDELVPLRAGELIQWKLKNHVNA